MPFLAFVAVRDIPAKTEFTVDYNPGAQKKGKGKGKGKKKANVNLKPLDAKPCHCGADACRDMIY